MKIKITQKGLSEQLEYMKTSRPVNETLHIWSYQVKCLETGSWHITCPATSSGCKPVRVYSSKRAAVKFLYTSLKPMERR